MERLRPRNGQTEKREPWAEDDAEDKLAERLANDPTPIPVDDEPEPLPTQTPTGRSDIKPSVQHRTAPSQCVAQPARPQQTHSTVNAKELIEVLVSAYMATPEDRLTMYVEGREIVVEQLQESDRGPIKATWRIGIAHMKTSTVRLLK